jgi:hypothetical protein
MPGLQDLDAPPGQPSAAVPARPPPSPCPCCCVCRAQSYATGSRRRTGTCFVVTCSHTRRSGWRRATKPPAAAARPPPPAHPGAAVQRQPARTGAALPLALLTPCCLPCLRARSRSQPAEDESSKPRRPQLSKQQRAKHGSSVPATLQAGVPVAAAGPPGPCLLADGRRLGRCTTCAAC